MITSSPAVKSWVDARGTSHNFMPNYVQRTPLEFAGLGQLPDMIPLPGGMEVNRNTLMSYGTGALAIMGLIRVGAAIGNGVYGYRRSGLGLGVGRGLLALLMPVATTAYSLGQSRA